MGDLVAEHGGELGLVFDAQQQPRPNHHEAVRRHRGVEAGALDDINADIVAILAGNAAGNIFDIGLQGLVLDHGAGRQKLSFGLFHLGPDAALVALRLGQAALARRNVGQRRGTGADQQ